MRGSRRDSATTQLKWLVTQTHWTIRQSFGNEAKSVSTVNSLLTWDRAPLFITRAWGCLRVGYSLWVVCGSISQLDFTVVLLSSAMILFLQKTLINLHRIILWVLSDPLCPPTVILVCRVKNFTRRWYTSISGEQVKDPSELPSQRAVVTNQRTLTKVINTKSF